MPAPSRKHSTTNPAPEPSLLGSFIHGRLQWLHRLPLVALRHAAVSTVPRVQGQGRPPGQALGKTRPALAVERPACCRLRTPCIKVDQFAAAASAEEVLTMFRRIATVIAAIATAGIAVAVVGCVLTVNAIPLVG
jgi:hypothetical protein